MAGPLGLSVAGPAGWRSDIMLGCQDKDDR
jgi:hypothetical protein